MFNTTPYKIPPAVNFNIWALSSGPKIMGSDRNWYFITSIHFNRDKKYPENLYWRIPNREAPMYKNIKTCIVSMNFSQLEFDNTIRTKQRLIDPQREFFESFETYNFVYTSMCNTITYTKLRREEIDRRHQEEMDAFFIAVGNTPELFG
jgi:hypothetical protein